MADRHELLRNAVDFLSDPKSQSAPMSQRVQFLEAKGLTAQEIDDAMRQSYSTQPGLSNASSSPPYPYPHQYHPAPWVNRQPWDWRDYFIMIVVSGSVVYGAVSLARKYLLPHLRPPAQTAYEADRDILAAQFDAAESLLTSIRDETASIRTAVDVQQQKVDEATQEVQAVTTLLKENEEKTRDEVREIRDEVNSIREMLPKMMDKNKDSQIQSLGELQQELKSLKALLLSRGPTVGSVTPPPFGASPARPSIPAWQLSGNSVSGISTSTPSIVNQSITPPPVPPES